MYCYYYINLDTIPLPRVAAYILLQGPLKEEDGSVGKAFEQFHNGYINLGVTAGWYILIIYIILIFLVLHHTHYRMQDI